MENYRIEKLKHFIKLGKKDRLDKFLTNQSKTSININDIMIDGRTPLSIAAEEGQYECVRVLVLVGKADVNKKDTAGGIALNIACYNYRLCINNQIDAKLTAYSNIIKFLIRDCKSNCNVRSQSNYEYTCLMHLCSGKPLDPGWHSNRLGLIKLLLEHGADRSLKNSYTNTAVEVAELMQNGNHDIAKLVKEYVTPKIDAERSNPSKDVPASQPVVTAVTPNPSNDIQHMLPPVAPSPDPTPVPASHETIDPDQKFANKKRELEQSIMITNLELQLATAMLALDRINAERRQLNDKPQDQPTSKSV